WELGSTPVDDENWERHRAQLDRRETFRDLLSQRIDADGRLRTHSISGTPVYRNDGTFAGYCGVGRDVTRQREQESREALQHKVTRLIAESASTRDVVCETIRAVCAACRWSGGVFISSGPAPTGPPVHSTVGDAPLIEGLRHCADATERDRIAAEVGFVARFACTIRAGDTHYGDLEFRNRGPLGVDPATLAAIADLGQQIGQSIARREAEASVRKERESLAVRVAERTLELRRAIEDLEVAKAGAEDANRAKSSFLATMSHEIRTPMNGVIGMIEVLAEGGLAKDQADVVRTIRTSAFSLLGLIDDILDFSKIEAGQLRLERSPTDLTELVEDVCDMLGPQCASNGVDLRLFVSPDVPDRVWCDPTRLRQTLNNLVANAVKFSAGRPGITGRVGVRVERVPGRAGDISFSVVDNGIGIPAAALPDLFTPFTQAETSTTRRFGGTGLGLVICKRLIALMDGTIDVRSVIDEGATFTVTLPLEAVEGAAPTCPIELAGLDCIIVAGPLLDDADLRTYLEHAGARVHVAHGTLAAARHAAGLSERLSIVIQHTGPTREAQAARGPFDGMPHVRHVMLVRRSIRSAAGTSGIVTLSDAGLRRRSLLQAVARAAGRDGPEVEPPVAPQRPVAGRVAPSIAQARAEGRLLLVAEDDAVNQQVILRQLALLGYAAELAPNGAEALDLWRHHRHALLLTDLHMPRLDGYGLTRAIRDAEAADPQRAHLPILALTANAMRDEAGRVLAAGMDEYLTKPIQLATLGAALGRWLPPEAHEPMPQSPDGPSTAIATSIDVSVLKGLIGDDPAMVRKFLAQFLDSARTQSADILASFETDDFGRICTVAHKLKASSRSIGAIALGDVCADLENASRADSNAELAMRRFAFEQAMRAAESSIVDSLSEAVG
ncbi:MAG: ATP-binding protein, partial [Caldimonas sp.]